MEEGADPEILMLKGLTYESGLPAGHKEIEMIEQARHKRELENNMLPFTDEACFTLRKAMMEAQELREYKLREIEVEAQRDSRLNQLKRTLEEREASTEFLASQRIEAIRQNRMEIREKTLQKIRKKRIHILRKLARQRNTIDPILSTNTARDIINDYYDRGSEVYAPIKREGKNAIKDTHSFEIASRTAPLTLIRNIDALDHSIPKQFTTVKSKAPPDHIGTGSQPFLSRTTPSPSALLGLGGGGRAAESRLTSAAQRNIRNTKKDIETMHVILGKKRLQRTASATAPTVTSGTGLGATGLGLDRTSSTEMEDRDLNATDKPFIRTELSQISEGNSLENLNNLPVPPGTSGPATTRNLLLNRKPKGRPRTPDYTQSKKKDIENLSVYSAVVLLQKLIRGRAVQNSMFEGRYRRHELINELRAVDEYDRLLQTNDDERQHVEEEKWNEVLEQVKDTTVESIAGSVTSNLLALMVQEKGREEYYKEMQNEANGVLQERKKRELAEAGRRQREGVPDLKLYTLKPPPEEPSESNQFPSNESSELERIMTPVSASFTDLVISSAAEKVNISLFSYVIDS